MRTSLLAVPLCLSLTATTACEVVGEDAVALDEIEATVPSTEVARAVISDGRGHQDVWQFKEAESGELFLHAILSDQTVANYRWVNEEDLSLVEVYQRLTGKSAPRSLIDAQARADSRTDEEDEADDQSGLENEKGGEAAPTGRLTQAISAADFQDNYCFYGWDYLYCWPSFYGSPYVQRKAYVMVGYVAAVNNTVDFRYRYKKHWYSSWSTLVSAQALPGQVHYAWFEYYGYRRWRRWEVLNNGNNLVRYSSQGFE